MFIQESQHTLTIKDYILSQQGNIFIMTIYDT